MKMKGLKFAKVFGLATLVSLVMTTGAKAQKVETIQFADKLPIDSSILYGKLDNGLTYFIKHNSNTTAKGKAYFGMTVRIGSIVEEDNERGLAHFLEHIAFNGTEHFPKKALLDYANSLGLVFGTDYNASTGFDATKFFLDQVPLGREGVVDSCLLILHDWANGISLEDEEIDLERGVILEESRLRDNLDKRIQMKRIAQILPKTKYPSRHPMGDMKVIKTFKPEVLKNFYKKWYRPNLQALIVVGDVKPKEIEAKIKKLFAPIKNPKNAPKRLYEFDMPSNSTSISITRDKELKEYNVSYAFRIDPLPVFQRGTLKDYERDYIHKLLFIIVCNRMNSQEDGADVLNVLDYEELSKWGDVLLGVKRFAGSVPIYNPKFVGGRIHHFINNFQTFKEYGVSREEVELANKSVLLIDRLNLNKEYSLSNRTFAEGCMKYYLQEENYLLSAQERYRLDQELIKTLPFEEINNEIKSIFSNKNQLLDVVAPEGISMPTKEAFSDLVKRSWATKVKPNFTEVLQGKLMKHKPKPKAIVKEEKGVYGSTIWTLSNGAKVIVKPTKYEIGKIELSASRKGGLMPLLKNQDDVNVRASYHLLNAFGAGDYSNREISQILVGHIADVKLFLNQEQDVIVGNCLSDDLEKMLQLLYLKIKDKRWKRRDFNDKKRTLIDHFKHSLTNPMNGLSEVFRKSLNFTDYPIIDPTDEEWKQVKYRKVKRIIKKKFSDVQDFNFVFVGDIDMAKLRPLVERYIASLPKGRKSRLLPSDECYRSICQGIQEKHYTRPVKQNITFWGRALPMKIKINDYNALRLDLLAKTLEFPLKKHLREDEGKVYALGSKVEIEPFRTGEAVVFIYSFCDPKNVEVLDSLLQEDLKRFAKEGFLDKDFEAARNIILEGHRSDLKTNTYWSDFLSDYYLFDRMYLGRPEGFEERLSKITKENVQELLKEILEQGNSIKIVYAPEKK